MHVAGACLLGRDDPTVYQGVCCQRKGGGNRARHPTGTGGRLRLPVTHRSMEMGIRSQRTRCRCHAVRG
eukprot:10921-Eustigmatos_ZCMA.PRE.1